MGQYPAAVATLRPEQRFIHPHSPLAKRQSRAVQPNPADRLPTSKRSGRRHPYRIAPSATREPKRAFQPRRRTDRSGWCSSRSYGQQSQKARSPAGSRRRMSLRTIELVGRRRAGVRAHRRSRPEPYNDRRLRRHGLHFSRPACQQRGDRKSIELNRRVALLRRVIAVFSSGRAVFTPAFSTSVPARPLGGKTSSGPPPR